MSSMVHPKGSDNQYRVPNRVPDSTLKNEWEKRGYKEHPSHEENINTLKRIESQQKEKDESINQSSSEKINLKSDTFTKDNSLLNDIALGRGRPLQLGVNNFEVLKVQQALNHFGFNVKANGVFCKETEHILSRFQSAHKPSHSIHSSYIVSDNCIVDSNLILRLDEALVEEWKIPLLRAECFKDSKHLNKLADGKVPAIKKGSKNIDEIERIQDALIGFGFDLGESGADGDFGSRTDQAIKLFQNEYKPTYNTHEEYQFEKNDGVVDKDLILALDEAVVERWQYQPKTFIFTLEMLKTVYPYIDDSKTHLLQIIVDELNKGIQLYKLDTPLRRTHFFAQIMQETGPRLTIEESFIYSRAGLSIFKAFENDPDLAKELSYDDNVRGKRTKRNGKPLSKIDFERIANIAYGGRLGNVEPGDGWKYRGRGLKQLTGRDNYISFTEWHQAHAGKWLKDKDLSFEDKPELLLNMKYAVRSAGFFWVNRKLYNLADNGSGYSSSESITKIVNFYTDSYQARFDNFKKLYSRRVFE